jgi:DNA repair photolyase
MRLDLAGWSLARDRGAVVKLQLVHDPEPPVRIVQPADGFAKKGLATHHVETTRICGFGCLYCSTNAGTSTRINLGRIKDLSLAQTGREMVPRHDPDLTVIYDADEVMRRLDAEIAHHGPRWGEGKTLVVSMLTDAFAPPPIADGLTERVVRALLAGTRFRLRILTKSALVGNEKWLSLFACYPDRIVVGLSIGTLDDDWARVVEINTSSPAARLRAHRALQEAGAATFGMLCPVFPSVLEGDALERLVGAIDGARCERVWFEPYNDRINAAKVAAGYDAGSRWARWFHDVYVGRKLELWSAYATELYRRVLAIAERGGWADRMTYLLYELDITADDAKVFREARMRGVLLQNKPDKKGFSQNEAFAAVQRELRP